MTRHSVIIVADTLRVLGNSTSGGAITGLPFLSHMLPKLTPMSNLVATSPWTLPSHLSLLTGLDPWRVEITPERRSYEFPKLPSLASEWTSSDGAAVSFSANPHVSHRNAVLDGFDSKVSPRSEVASALAVFTSSRVDRWVLCPSLRRNYAVDHKSSPLLSRVGQFLSHSVASALDGYWRYPALEADLDATLRNHEPRTPLLIFFNLMEAHEPYASSWHKSSELAGASTSSTFSLSTVSQCIDNKSRFASALRQVYASSLERLDRRCAQVWGLLAKHGILRDCSLLFVSDHGQCLGEHNFVGHGQFLYDELVRIPGYVGKVKDGRPSSIGFDILRPLDLRHVHDIVSAQARSVDACYVAEALQKSHEARGRPVTYWENLPTSGVGVHAAVRGKLRRLRVFSELGSVSFDVDGVHPETRATVEGNLDEGAVAALEVEATSILRRCNVPVFLRDGKGNPELDATDRLRTWGYLQ